MLLFLVSLVLAIVALVKASSAKAGGVRALVGLAGTLASPFVSVPISLFAALVFGRGAFH